MLISQFGCKATKKVKKGVGLLLLFWAGETVDGPVTNAHLRRTRYILRLRRRSGNGPITGWPRDRGSFLTPSPCVDIGLKLCGGGDISKINEGGAL